MMMMMSVHIVGLWPPVTYAFLFTPMRATCFILHILFYFYRPIDIGRYRRL